MPSPEKQEGFLPSSQPLKVDVELDESVGSGPHLEIEEGEIIENIEKSSQGSSTGENLEVPPPPPTEESSTKPVEAPPPPPAPAARPPAPTTRPAAISEQPSPPASPIESAVGRVASSEEREEILEKYFRDIQNVPELLLKVEGMLDDAKLRATWGIEGLQQLVGDIYPEVSRWATHEPGMVLHLQKLPFGVQSVIRRILKQEEARPPSAPEPISEAAPAAAVAAPGGEAVPAELSEFERIMAGIDSPPTPPGPAPVPAGSPTPSPTVESIGNDELKRLGLEGTGWKESTAVEAAAVPAIRTGAELVRASNLRPLHERVEVTTTTADNPDLFAFHKEIERRGVFTGLGLSRREIVDVLQGAFEQRGAVARGLVEFYRDQISSDIGLPFHLEAIAPKISAYVERVSVEQPEKILTLNKLLTEARTLSEGIPALTQKLTQLTSVQNMPTPAGPLGEKNKALELAKATNAFLPNFKIWQDDAKGWGRLTWIRGLIGTRAKEQAAARKKVKELGYGKPAYFLGGLKNKEIEKELKEIGTLIRAEERATTEASLRSSEERLKKLKAEILSAGAVNEEAGEIMRKGIREVFGGMLNPQQPSVEGFEAAETTLDNLLAVSKKGDVGVRAMDYLRDLDPNLLRDELHARTVREARRALRKIFMDTLENPRAPDRLSALKAALDPWFRREKIGPRKSKDTARNFILGELDDYIKTLFEDEDKLAEEEGLIMPGDLSARGGLSARLMQNEMKKGWIFRLRDEIADAMNRKKDTLL